MKNLRKSLVAMWIILMLIAQIIPIQASTTGGAVKDYTAGVTISVSGGQIWFKPHVPIKSVHVHYRVNEGSTLRNLQMVGGSTLVRDIPNIEIGDTVTYGFTYDVEGDAVGAKDTQDISEIITADTPGTELLNLGIQVFDKNGIIQKEMNEGFTATSGKEVKDIYDEAVRMDPGMQVGISVLGTNIALQQYQIIKHVGEGTPAIPNIDSDKWLSVGDINQVEVHTKEAYLDLMLDKKGFLSTSHYNYKYDSTEYGATDAPPKRAETFGYPIGEALVIQEAKISTNNQYYNTAGSAAFFGNSAIGKTTIDSTFTAPKSGAYKFSVYSNNGAIVTIKIGENNKYVVNNYTESTSSSAPRAYHFLTNNTVELEQGKQYQMHMEWRQAHSNHIAPRLCYEMKETGATSFSAVKVVPTEHFSNEKYQGGANKAVKYWGYIIPDKSGEFNLGSYSDDGAYGYIITGKDEITGKDKEIVFVNDWAIQAAYNRSGEKKDGPTPTIVLEKGKVYPIYMEWYEGCPTDKAFTPRYRNAKEGTWTNIPQDWFYASSNATPGQTGEAYFVPTEADKYNTLVEPAKYYIALQVKSNDGTIRQIMNGPFIVNGMTAIFNASAKNYIVPESLSNVSYVMQFTEESKNIKYEINLEEMLAKKLGTNNLMDYDLNKAIITLNRTGSVTEILGKGTDYQLARFDPTTGKLTGDTAVNINGFVCNLSGTVQTGDKHTINIYFPTKFSSSDIKYGDPTATVVDASTYVGAFLDKKVAIKVNITATPIIRGKDAVTKELLPPVDGTPQSKEQPIDLTYRQMPKIL